MSLAVLNLPAEQPGGATVHVTVMPWRDPGEARIRFSVPHGMTLADILLVGQPYIPAGALDRVRVALVDGTGCCAIDRALWHVVRPNPGVHVIARVVPAGPIVAAVLPLITSVAAQAIGAPLGAALGLGQFGTSLLTFALTTAGGILLNMLFAQSAPDPSRGKEEKPSYSISGWKNELQPDGFVPVTFGTIRYAPRYAAYTWTEVVGDDVYIRSCFLWGRPCVITDLKIGETRLEDFDEVEIETVTGIPTEELLTLYTKQVIEESIGADLILESPRDDNGELTDDPPVEKPTTRRTADDVTEAGIIFYFPGGFFRTDSEGKQRPVRVEVEVSYRLVGDSGAYTVVDTLVFWEEKKRAFFRFFKVTFPERGRYDVRLTRKTESRNKVGDVDTIKWFALQSFRPEYPFNFEKPITLTALRIKATAQLNSTLDTFNGVPSGLMRDFVGNEWISGQTPKNPAAHAIHELTGDHRAYPAPDDEIDWPRFEEWHGDCVNLGLEYNRVHDFDASHGEMLEAIGAAGRGAVWHDGEKWTVTIDKPQEIIVDHVNPRNASGFGWGAVYLDDAPEEYRVSFLDETTDFRPGERVIPWPADFKVDTLALLAADLDHPEGRTAQVTDDPTPANNRYYRKVGPRGSGSWTIRQVKVSETIRLPGKTNPDEIWIEARRLQYERIHRNVSYRATQPGSARVLTMGDPVMLSRDILVRAMHSGRVLHVAGNRVETDATFVMAAGQDYAIRFRRLDPEDKEDTLGQSVLRTIKTVAGENKAITLTGSGHKPKVGDLVHFGLAATDSIKAIVAGISREEDTGDSTLHMLPAADAMHAKVAAEVPPPWSNRVGPEDDGSDETPAVPAVVSVRSGLDGTGDPDGLLIRLRPGEGSSVQVKRFEVQHRLQGAGSWETPVSAPAASALISLTGYSSGDAVEWQPRAVSVDGEVSAWGSTRTTTIGASAPMEPVTPANTILLNGSRWVRMSYADILSEGIPAAAYIRRDDRLMPDGTTHAVNGGYFVLDDDVMKVDQFGTGFAAAQAALKHHAFMGRALDFGPGAMFFGGTGDVLDIPTGSRITGAAAFNFSDAAPTGTGTGTSIVTIGDNVTAGEIYIEEPGGAAEVVSNYAVLIGNNPSIDHIELRSETQRARVGIRWDADTIVGRLGRVVTRKVDRPLAVNNLTGAATRAATQIVIGDLDFDSYVTAFRPAYLNYLITGHVRIGGRSPNSSKVPGANAILNQACGRHVYLNPIWLSDSAEHLWRIGNPEGETGDDADDVLVYIPWIFARNAGGCAFKCTQKTTTFARIHVGGITATNVGCETYGHGEEVIRLAKMDNVFIGPVYSFKTEGNFLEGYVHPVSGGDPVDLPNVFPRAAVQMQDCSNFRIGPIYGGYRAQIVDFYGASDLGNTGGGPVENGTILIGDAVCEGGAAIRFYATENTDPGVTPLMTASDIRIRMDGASGWTTNLVGFGRPSGTDPHVELTGQVKIFGEIGGDVSPIMSSNETDRGHEKIVIDLGWNGKRRQGVLQDMRRSASAVNQLEEIVAGTATLFNPGDFEPTGRVINNRRHPAGNGNFSTAIAEPTQLASRNRGGAIVNRQMGGNSHQMGWEFYTGPSTGSSNALNLSLRLKHTGDLQMHGDNTVIDANRLLNARAYTVATLPTPGTAGRVARATDLRVFDGAGVQEGAAAGTGGLVEDSGAAWRIVGTNVTAVA